MTRVLLVGSGAREHALACALVKTGQVKLYAAMSSKNPGIMKLAENASVMEITDPYAVANYAKLVRVELAVVGPEASLVNAVVDKLSELGVRCVGPVRKLASLEGDKVFCRKLLDKYQIPGNPIFRVFTDVNSAEDFLKNAGPVAIKPTGLTGGKGVKLSGVDLPTKESELAYVRDVFRTKIGGGNEVLVEERLDGEEYSLQAFVDGRGVYAMPLVQDHKRAYENDSGPNTGGMGSYSDRDHLLPFMYEADLEISTRIMNDVVNALKVETGEEYKGVLYGQFMIAKGFEEDKPSPKLIEFNCRFGDPEALNVLSLLSEEVDFLEVCERIAAGTLKTKYLPYLPKASVCKYLVPKGYPHDERIGQPIFVDEEALLRLGAGYFYASVNLRGGNVLTTASRTVAVTGIADTIDVAERIAEKATAQVKGPLRHRADIGTTSLIRKRIEHMKSIRSGEKLTTSPISVGMA